MQARGKNASVAKAGSAGKRRPSTSSKRSNLDELPEQPILIWPEWVDSEVQSEKWNTKHVFEDPDGQIILPRSLRQCHEGFKRLVELSDILPIGMSAPGLAEGYFQCQQKELPVTGAIGRSQTVSASQAKSNTDPLAEVSEEPAPMSTQASKEDILEAAIVEEGDQPEMLSTSTKASRNSINATEPNAEPTSDVDPGDVVIATSNLFKTNNHLIGSEFIRSILVALHLLYEQADQAKATKQANNVEEMYPWEFIYPKSKDGLPQYNASGKYIVKLFWLGAWRKITVDDRIPVDADGKPLLVASPFVHELWPLILCKALMKIASASYREDNSCEHGDFDVLSALRGWVPERLAVNQHKYNNVIWDTMVSLGLKNGYRGSSAAAINNTASIISTPKAAPKQQSNRTSVVTDSASSKLAPINVLAMRDGEENPEKPDINTLPFAFRVTEIREGYNSSKADHDGQKQVRIKHYFSCGYVICFAYI
jgi:hypothetical protein